MRRSDPRGNRHAPGFSLVELLVVISVISALMGILVTAIAGGRDHAQLVQCAATQRQLLVGISAFAGDHQFRIPHGSTSMSPFGVPWSEFPGGLLWTGEMSMELTGVGVLMEGYVEPAEAYFCAGEDVLQADEQLSNLHTDATAVGSYAYRSLAEMNGRFLGNLGTNSAGLPVRCLLYDAQLIGAGPDFDHTTHGGTALCLGFADGSAHMVTDTEQRFVFFADGPGDLFARIVSEPERLFVLADSWR